MAKLQTDICQYEAILTNHRDEHSCEEIASIEEDLFTARHIVDLWEEFGDVPMHPVLEITEKDWHGFPAGAHRETIWHWFEDYFHISVAEDLMY